MSKEVDFVKVLHSLKMTTLDMKDLSLRIQGKSELYRKVIFHRNLDIMLGTYE